MSRSYTYVQSSGGLDGLQSPTAQHRKGPLLGLRVLPETQAEHLGGQVDVPVGRVLLYQIAYHPVNEQETHSHDRRRVRSASIRKKRIIGHTSGATT